MVLIMSEKVYRLYCEICEWKKIVRTSDDIRLVEIKTSPIPGGSPVYNPETKKTDVPKSKNQPKKFKCPQCGRVIIPKKIIDVQTDIDADTDAEIRRRKIIAANIAIRFMALVYHDILVP